MLLFVYLKQLKGLLYNGFKFLVLLDISSSSGPFLGDSSRRCSSWARSPPVTSSRNPEGSHTARVS